MLKVHLSCLSTEVLTRLHNQTASPRTYPNNRASSCFLTPNCFLHQNPLFPFVDSLTNSYFVYLSRSKCWPWVAHLLTGHICGRGKMKRLALLNHLRPPVVHWGRWPMQAISHIQHLQECTSQPMFNGIVADATQAQWTFPPEFTEAITPSYSKCN